jgi:hypothetical protein
VVTLERTEEWQARVGVQPAYLRTACKASESSLRFRQHDSVQVVLSQVPSRGRRWSVGRPLCYVGKLPTAHSKQHWAAAIIAEPELFSPNEAGNLFIVVEDEKLAPFLDLHLPHDCKVTLGVPPPRRLARSRLETHCHAAVTRDRRKFVEPSPVRHRLAGRFRHRE